MEVIYLSAQHNINKQKNRQNRKTSSRSGLPNYHDQTMIKHTINK